MGFEVNISFQVFEILSHLTPALPNFSRGNWQSTARHYVRIHDDYTDITRMFGLTTIVYHDREGTLTKLFVEKGYLDASLWLDRRPLYFMDVKSTTGPCDDAFSMSASEYGKVNNLIILLLFSSLSNANYRLMMMLDENVYQCQSPVFRRRLCDIPSLQRGQGLDRDEDLC